MRFDREMTIIGQIPSGKRRPADDQGELEEKKLKQ